MGRWTLAAVRRAPDIPLILDETSQGFTACMASLLGGTDLGVSRLQKKRLALGCQVKLPACRPVRRGCFSAPVLFSTITQPFGWKEFFNSVSDAFQHRAFQHSETWRSWSARGWTVPERFLTGQILRRPHLTIYYSIFPWLDPTWIHVMYIKSTVETNLEVFVQHTWGWWHWVIGQMVLMAFRFRFVFQCFSAQ